MDQPREAREQILTLQTDVRQLRYFISLIDLLATCAEVSNYCQWCGQGRTRGEPVPPNIPPNICGRKRRSP